MFFVIVPCDIRGCTVCDTENVCTECNSGLVPDSTGESCIEVDNGETDRNSDVQNNDALSSDAMVGIIVGKSYYDAQVIHALILL